MSITGYASSSMRLMYELPYMYSTMHSQLNAWGRKIIAVAFLVSQKKKKEKKQLLDFRFIKLPTPLLTQTLSTDSFITFQMKNQGRVQRKCFCSWTQTKKKCNIMSI